LILFNLLARRDAMLELGGFDESLYPNEENALMDDLQKRGGKLLYDPHCIVFRRPRSSLRAFGRMLLTYGRGRAEQFRLHPTLGSALNLVPPLFCLYLALLPLLMYGCPAPWAGLVGKSPDGAPTHVAAPDLAHCVLAPEIVFFPLTVYVLAIIVQTLWSAVRKGLVLGVLALPLVVLTHLCYGIGFWRGLFTTLRPAGRRAVAEVTLENISL